MIRVLVFSSLYPSSIRPGYGIFVETRLRELLTSRQVEARVVSPVPWFFSTNDRFGDYARMARTPRMEVRNGVEVHHPRYMLIPKVGMYVQPFSMAISAMRAVRALQRGGFDFDLIDAHYFYPDGVAAALIAKWTGKPLVITARGTDVNHISKLRVPGMLVRWAGRRAAGLIGVSQALVEEMRAQGIGGSRRLTLRNGVDLTRFAPEPVDQARSGLKLDGEPLLLSVGNLVPLKGHDVAIEALAILRERQPGVRLVIAGEGPDRRRLEALIQSRGLADSVTLVGAVPNAELYRWYSAADALILASQREGWPNVLLESMACGTPVAATRVSGIPEIVREGVSGVLVDPRTPSAFAERLEALLAMRLARSSVRDYAKGFGWEATTQGQLNLFREVLVP